jgi:phage FluMu protein gp41
MSTMQTVTGTFVIGLSINGVTHKDFEIREPLVADMVEAEKEVPPTDLHAFNVQMLCRVVTRIGDFKGPFTPGMFNGLKRPDYNRLVQKMLEADSLGEPPPAAAAVT